MRRQTKNTVTRSDRVTELRQARVILEHASARLGSRTLADQHAQRFIQWAIEDIDGAVRRLLEVPE